MSEILVVTSPSGQQCAHLMPHLYEKSDFKLRLAAHSQGSFDRLKEQYPKAEVVKADLLERSTCRDLLRGATSVYHVGPSLHAREAEIGNNMVDAAVAESKSPGNKFKHFVFSSVLFTQSQYLIQHHTKCLIEEQIMLSPINWTILQPTNFMDAYPVALFKKQEKLVLEKLWDPDVPNSVIALWDLGEAAAKVLLEREKHYLAEYKLCSTMPVSDRDMVEAIERQLGKKIEVKTPSVEAGTKNLLRYLFGGKEDGQPTEGRSNLTTDFAERLVLFYNP